MNYMNIGIIGTVGIEGGKLMKPIVLRFTRRKNGNGFRVSKRLNKKKGLEQPFAKERIGTSAASAS